LEGLAGGPALPLEVEAVLGVEPQPSPPPQHAKERPAGQRRQLLEAGGEQPLVAAELVDHEAGHMALVVGLEQGKGPEQRREHPAAVDVADQQHRQPGGPRQSHVGQVVAAQVDLGRAPRPLADDHVVA
jgi:hypothetical protein